MHGQTGVSVDKSDVPTVTWHQPLSAWTLFATAAVLIAVAFHGALAEVVMRWSRQAEYSHGYLIPLVALFFAWRLGERLRRVPSAPAWSGVILVCLAVAGLVLGELTALFLIIQVSFLATLLGLLLASMGWRATRVMLVPVLLLGFAIPLPYFLEADLSGGLQLLSSRIGVEFIRTLEIPVYLEGNVIDLGTYQLQVVDACSGLRYLFPLMSFGFICVYLWRAPLWKKGLVFLSTIPITIAMNSARIGVIGALASFAGIGAADGFLHFFEGWIIFMACVGLLLVEILLLSRIKGRGETNGPVFELVPDRPAPVAEQRRLRQVTAPFMVAVGLLAAGTAGAAMLNDRQEGVPRREPLASFPETLGPWQGERQPLSAGVVEVLQPSDYLLATYSRSLATAASLYVAYYENQRKGRSPHSPRVCIPGGGWRIVSMSRRELHLERLSRVLHYNRVLIQRGDERQVVYYWFQQRGRLMANEYVAKWYLFWDALWRNRSDGALVRLSMPVEPGEPPAELDEHLASLARATVPALDPFIPR